jgi:hypothetical protein
LTLRSLLPVRIIYVASLYPCELASDNPHLLFFFSATYQPGTLVYENQRSDPQVNGTMFILLTDTDLHVTPFNIADLNAHVVAGPAVYQAG